jgi:putative addiction module component (TIGR02574 family)
VSTPDEELPHNERDQLEVPSDVRAELDRRLAAHRENPGAALSWDEVKRRALGRE